MIGALSMAFSGQVVMAFAETIPVAVVGLSLVGASFGLSWPASQSMVATIVPSAIRPRYFGMNFALLNLGVGIGGIIGGFVADVERPITFQVDVPRRGVQLPSRRAAPPRPAAACRRPAPYGAVRRRRAGRRRRHRLPCADPTAGRAVADSPLVRRRVHRLCAAQLRAAGLCASGERGVDARSRLGVCRQHLRDRRPPAVGAATHRGLSPHQGCRADGSLLGGLVDPSRCHLMDTRHGRSDTAGCRMCVRLRARRDAAPAHRAGDGQRPGAGPSARSLQRSQLGGVPGRVGHRAPRCRVPDRSRPGRCLDRRAARRRRAGHRGCRAVGRAAAPRRRQRRQQELRRRSRRSPAHSSCRAARRRPCGRAAAAASRAAP